MKRFASAESLVFGSSCRFIAYQIRICAAQTCWAYSFVRIYHNLMFGSFFYTMQVMVVHPLAVVMFPIRKHVAYISAFYGIVSVFVHQLVGCFEVPFVVDGRA